MKIDVQAVRTFAIGSAFFLVLLVCCSGPGLAEDAAARSERIQSLVESLNAGYSRRAQVTAQIYNALRGDDAAEMRAALTDGLYHGNLLVQMGVVETMAMAGDLRDVDDLATVLETTRRFQVRTSILRFLPAFLLWNNERARLAFVRYVNEGGATGDAQALAQIQAPPLTRRGRIDPVRDELFSRIADLVIRQFDPVKTAITHVSDPLVGEEAKAAVLSYVGSALGNDPGRWQEVWQTLERDLPLANADEVEEIRMYALAALAEIGAEAQPEVIDSLNYLFSFEQPVLTQAIYKTLAAMCRSAYAELRLVNDPDFGMRSGEAESAWLERRQRSAERLALYAPEIAGKGMNNANVSVALAAIECLGAAVSYPLELLNSDGAYEEARKKAVEELALSAMSPDVTTDVRRAVITALGETGAGEAVGVVEEILASPYSRAGLTPEGEQIAESCVAALVALATGQGDGANAARNSLLDLLHDDRSFPPLKAGVPPVRMGYLVMWRLQRLASTGEISLDREFWQSRLGW